MGVCLMANVPHQPVVRRVEDVVESHYDVDGAHARSEMSRILRQARDEIRAYLVAHLRQLLHRQRPKVGRAVDRIQKRGQGLVGASCVFGI